MNPQDTTPAAPVVEAQGLNEAVERACARIAPAFPLDRFIAVNPFWSSTHEPVSQVSARMSAWSGTRLLMPRAWYREQWLSGRITAQHLSQALAEAEVARTVSELEALLGSEQPEPARRARMTDVLDAQRDPVHEMSWREFVTHSVSQFCAGYFDDGQARLGPSRAGGLYATFRRQALEDRSPELLMGLARFRELARGLPEQAHALFAHALSALDVAAAEREAYLTSLLLDINGWASLCAYRRWTARQQGADDAALVDLLAIRLAWELLLLRAGGRGAASRWQMAMASWPAIDRAAKAAQKDDWLLQRALEIAYQQQLCADLPQGLAAAPPSEPSVQAVFCIDVRSEVLRRALEAQSPRVQTLGFAGFFGLPIEYRPLSSHAACPQLPGLLAPRLCATDEHAPEGLAEQRANRLDVNVAWKRFKQGALSGFSYVEALGLFFAGKLVGDSVGLTRPVASPARAGLSLAESAHLRPRLTSAVSGSPFGVNKRCDLAAGILRGMSLTRRFARLVLLVGHGSETVNNPHAAGLDCGACCGQTGEVNARAAAALLNDPEVRAGLAERGIRVPDSTWFVAGLHNTTTDEVELFELDALPTSHDDELGSLKDLLHKAGDRARTERARTLGLVGRDAPSLHAEVRSRARDWSQIRPEWGLANNAAFIVAPREHCLHLDLAGRSFLHEYRWEEDAGFATLELIMTAPMVVTHWINFQYYASTVDNQRYGSGNKVLHNVVGGHLGVFEGNGGDLRIGLPMQSLHDGERWVHTPLRLSVFIEAPRQAIDAVLQKHAHVRALVENEWLYLFQLDAREGGVRAYRRGEWPQVASANSFASASPTSAKP